jgi:hypothetical protein
MTTTPQQLPTPAEFHDRCAAHDWHYHYSDDPRVYHRGHADAEALRSIASAEFDVGTRRRERS